MTYLAVESVAQQAPSHWDWIPFGRLARIRRQPNRERSLRLLALSAHTGVNNRPDDGGRQLPAESTIADYWRVVPDDLVFNPMWAFQGGLAVSSIEGAVSPAYRVYELGDRLHPRFVHHFLRSSIVLEQFHLLVRGITTFDRSITRDDFERMPVPVPPLSEQRAIADFLDRETARIDTLTRARSKSLLLLEERKQAVVNRLLMGSADSLPSWAGSWGGLYSENAPEGWAPRPLKHYLVANDSGVWGEEPVGDGDTLVLRSTEITREGNWDITEPASRHLSQADRARGALKAGDLLVVTSSGSQDHIGKTAVVDRGVEGRGAAFSNFTQRLRLREGDSKYFWYFLNSSMAREQLAYLANTTTGLRNLNGSVLAELMTPGAPVEAQRRIARQLDDETARIAEMVDTCDAYVQLLREHRQALISRKTVGGE